MIRKAVIPAAGFGTRLLPATKAQPKEMLPVVDKPIIQYVVEEAVSSGVTDIIIVTGASKRAIEDHFDVNPELEHWLEQQGKTEMLEKVKRIANMANFVYIRQKGNYGNGTPVLNAKGVVGNEPFAVLWGDEFITAPIPRLQQMVQVHEKYGGVVISGVRIGKKEDLKRYGIADIEPVEGNVYKIKGIVEKPDPDKAPSDLATHGAYILPPEIFAALESLDPGKGGEIWLTDGINKLRDAGVPIYACEVVNGTYFDCGNRLEYLKTNIEFALQDEELGEELMAFLRTKLSD